MGTYRLLLLTLMLMMMMINCLPGTDEERGLAAWSKEMALDAAGSTEGGDTYDFPIGMTYIRRYGWMGFTNGPYLIPPGNIFYNTLHL